MAEVACPSCGKAVRLPEGLASMLLQCKGCGLTFEATAPRPPRSRPPRPALSPPLDDVDVRRRITRPGANLRKCPVCDEPIERTAERCANCGEGLTGAARTSEAPDCERHRGPLVLFLGTVSLLGGLLALVSLGLSGLLSLPAGILAWLLAERDLRKMEANTMDRSGMAATGTGRQNAIAGVVLSVLIGLFYLGLLLLVY